MKKLPTGIQNITEILTGDFVYIDKTKFVLSLIKKGKHYFLSRPRRFGKSLFISTLKEVFSGNRQLFKDCEIYKSDYKWNPHPVLQFDFSLIANRSPEDLEQSLKESLHKKADEHGLTIKGSSLHLLLANLIEGMAKKQRVVVLVDEYDKPIINNLHQLDVAEKNRDILRDFFGVIKGLDEYIQFSFVTGVTKFSQVSLFSGPNNLDDISLDTNYSSMMGYTKAEIEKHLAAHIDYMIKKRSSSHDSILSELKEWYNGYCFSEKCELVYNPFSTLLYFSKEKACSYWFRSGTPSFLIEQVKQQPTSVLPLSGDTALKNTLADISNFEHINLTALMFQTGYLTIQSYTDKEDSYTLDFPNREVREAFFNSLLQEFAQVNPLDILRSAKTIQNALEQTDIDTFISQMNIHFAKIPYQLFSKANEGFFHALFLTFLEKSGIKTSAEVATNIGSIDLIAQTQNYIYVFELKLDKSADIAIDQIKSKKYAERFSSSEKNMAITGINFSGASRNISEWKAQIFSPTGKLVKELHATP